MLQCEFTQRLCRFLGVTQLALQRHEVPKTHKNYRHAYGAYRQHDDHAWSAFTGSGFFCGFNDAALGCLLWHQALLDFWGDTSSTRAGRAQREQVVGGSPLAKAVSAIGT